MDRLQQILDRLANGAVNSTRYLPDVLGNPRAHPREAMLLAVIAALLLLVVATALMVSWDSFESRRRQKSPRVRIRRRGRWLRFALVATALLLGVVVAGVAPSTRLASPACGACHATRQAIESWRTQSHAEVACYGCHATPGITGALQASVTGAAARLSRSSKTAALSVDSRGCLGCHGDVLDNVVGELVRVSHKEIEAAGTACVACHGEVGHGGSDDESIVQRKTMTRCMGCHDDSRAPSGCPTCHVDNPSDRASEPSGEPTSIAVTCDGGCHSDELTRQCIDCHGLELPHPSDFVRRHAGMSAAEPKLCARCHEEASENEGCACHQPGTIHGSYSLWFPAHGEAASLNGPGGCACHDKNDYAFCAKCHDRYPW